MPALYQNNKDVPQDMLLGNMLFLNLVDMRVDESNLLNAFSMNNLPQHFVRKISKSDAFRRASSSIKGETIDWEDSNGVFKAKVNVDEVVNSKDEIKRIVGVRVLNDALEEVYYRQIGTAQFYRDTEVCNVSLNLPSDVTLLARGECSNLLDKIKNNYADWSVYHNKDTVKNTIKRVIDSMHPIALMPTGICKFIPKEQTDTLYGLKGLLNDLSSFSTEHKENTVEIIPIIDTQEHRDLVEKQYQGEIKDTLYEYMQELTTIINTKQKLSTRQVATYLTRYKELKSKITEYENLLGIYTQNIQQQLKYAIQFIDDNKEEDA